MEPRIVTLTEKKFIGIRLFMSLSENKTAELWKSFMPRRKEIQNAVGTDLYSMQLYDHLYFRDFNPDKEFEKWAVIEVTDFNTVPYDMKTITVGSGLYAVFIHKGGAVKGPEIFNFIFGIWLPGSDYELDNRPHFEILGEKFKNDDPDSEEEIWIPVKRLPAIRSRSGSEGKYPCLL